MTGKIFKYETQAIGRVLLPIYAAMAAVSILLALTARILIDNPGAGYNENRFVNGLVATLGILYFCLIIAACVMTFAMIVSRFYKNFLGSQGYLMFALPVTTAQHITGRAASGLLWTVLSGLAAILSVMIGGLTLVATYGFGDFWPDFKRLLSEISIDAPMTILVFFLALAAVLHSILRVYAAIAIGHQLNSHRLMGSVGAYIGIGFVQTFLTAFLAGMGTAFGQTGVFSLVNLEMVMEMEDRAQALAACGIGIATNLVMAAVFFLVTWLLLDRRLNLE